MFCYRANDHFAFDDSEVCQKVQGAKPKQRHNCLYQLVQLSFPDGTRSYFIVVTNMCNSFKWAHFQLFFIRFAIK